MSLHNSPVQILLMIEDDARLAAMVGAYLRDNGFRFNHAADASTGLSMLGIAPATDGPAPADGNLPDLILLDLMLPDLDGLEVCRRIRAAAGAVSAIPLMMLTAKGDAMDRVVGLELGADDYLPKPFEPRELLARIRALLRRGQSSTQQARHLLSFGSLQIDVDARRVSVAERTCELTSYQFDLLLALAERAGRVLSRDQIMDAVRGRELEAFDRSIDVHVGRIRQAIELDAKAPKRILTVRGVGYVFSRQQD